MDRKEYESFNGSKPLYTFMLAASKCKKSMNDTERKYFTTNNLIVGNKEFINDAIENSKYEWTCKVFVQKIKVIKSIIQAIENTDPEISFYTTCILFRSVIEHFLVAEYIFTNDRLNKNSNCGEEYFSDYIIGETIKRFRYKLDIQKKVTKVDQAEIFEYIKANFPKLGNTFNKSHDLQKPSETFNKYSGEKRLLEYFYHFKQKEAIDDIQNELYKQIVEKFNFLSSYVHGGPSSEIETLTIFNIEEKVLKHIESIDFMKLFVSKISTNLFTLLYESTGDLTFSAFTLEINGELK